MPHRRDWIFSEEIGADGCFRPRFPHGDFCGGYGVDPNGPTTCRPGSAEKIAVLRDRAARKVSLHHPDDFQDRDHLGRFSLHAFFAWRIRSVDGNRVK